MATKSFLKAVHLKGQKQSRDFIRALEKSSSMPIRENTAIEKARDLTQEQIKKIFVESKLKDQ